jgi:hypothetical protein
MSVKNFVSENKWLAGLSVVMFVIIVAACTLKLTIDEPTVNVNLPDGGIEFSPDVYVTVPEIYDVDSGIVFVDSGVDVE